MEAIGLCVRVGQRGINHWLPKALAGHLEIANQIFVLICPSRDLNDLVEVGRVLSLDVGVCDGPSVFASYASVVGTYLLSL